MAIWRFFFDGTLLPYVRTKLLPDPYPDVSCLTFTICNGKITLQNVEEVNRIQLSDTWSFTFRTLKYP